MARSADLYNAMSRVTVDQVRQASWMGDDGWRICFPRDFAGEAKAPEERVRFVKKLIDFFLSGPGIQLISMIPEETYALSLDFQLLRAPDSPEVLKSIAAALEDNPDEVLSQIALSSARAAEIALLRGMLLQCSLGLDSEKPVPRITNFSPFTAIRNLRAASVGKFVAIRGTCVRCSNPRQQLVSMRFSCRKCRQVQTVNFTDFKYSVPVPQRCPTPRCRSRNFEPILSSAKTVDWQRIRIQEINERDDREEGRMPRTLDAELVADLIDSCIPGDIVVVNGIIRVQMVESGGGGKSARAAKALSYMYLHANSISTPRNTDNGDIILGKQSSVVESSEMNGILSQVFQQQYPFSLLVHSLAPLVIGHNEVKVGLLLALFGGAAKTRISPSGKTEDINVRRDIHCLLVGDPGMAKSVMLKSISRISPRGVYVCGNTTSVAGLTCTVVREGTGDFALEAGALVLGDRGMCCIDEFDKMTADHGALLEGMEQQSVSIAKAGLIANLKARTTVVAAGNAVGGHYDFSRTISENIKLPQPLLSRFDLVYILTDRPDAVRDRQISEHIISMFGMKKPQGDNFAPGNGNVTQVGQRTRIPTQANENFIPYEEVERTSLLERLGEMKVRDPLPPSVFRSYIQYARTYVHPVLSKGAKDVLQAFYLELRKGAKEQDSTPVTTRQLESLIRLSEARARSVLRSEVTVEDAKDVIEIMRESMLAALTDETGKVDLERSGGMSRPKDVRKFTRALEAEAERSRNANFNQTRLRSLAESIGIKGVQYRDVLESINYSGVLLKKGHGNWSLEASRFSQR